MSLIASLEVLLNNHKILDMVAEPCVSEPHSTLLIDFADGTVVQQHELFNCDHQSLKIILKLLMSKQKGNTNFRCFTSSWQISIQNIDQN